MQDRMQDNGLPHSTRRNLWKDEQGQVLAQVAVILVALLGFVALSVDMGHSYAERRRMQNAADAAALAGARQLCLLDDATAAENEAERYLLENGVSADEIVEGDISVAGHIINVTARTTADTFVAGVIGLETVDIAAGAAAACGAANSACGLWPIAFELDLWNGDGKVECGEEFIVWNDENKEIACYDENGVVMPETDICDCYDCDSDDNGEDDFAVIGSTSRGWLDLSGNDEIFTDPCSATGCGASELACQIRNDSGARITLGESGICIAGTRGVKAGVKDDVDARIGHNLMVPIYDSTGCTVPGGNNCTGTDADTFHITKFGCITVIGWDQNFTLDPINPDDKYNKKITGKVIRASLNCSGNCVTGCGGTDGSAPEPWEARAVSLIE